MLAVRHHPGPPQQISKILEVALARELQCSLDKACRGGVEVSLFTFGVKRRSRERRDRGTCRSGLIALIPNPESEFCMSGGTGFAVRNADGPIDQRFPSAGPRAY